MDRRQLLKTTIAATASTVIPAATSVAADTAASAIVAAPKPIDLRPYANYVFEWFVSADGETYYEGFETKDEAIAYAKASDMAIVAECRSQDFDLEVYGPDILERLNESNYEKIGDGDGIQCTRAQEDDLTRMLTRTMEAWVVKHNIDIRAWSFAEVKNETKLS